MTDPAARAEATAHTPGPWTAEQHGPKLWQIDAAHDAVATTAFCYAPESEANARLIAAAPDLVAALKDARRRLAHIAATCGHPNAIEGCRLNVIEAQRAQAVIDAALAKAGIR